MIFSCDFVCDFFVISREVYEKKSVNCPSDKGITIDAGLKFDQHVKTLYQKVNKNVTAFSRVATLLDLDKAKLLYNSFMLSNFNYCPLIWIFCGKQCNKEINRVHKRALRALLGDYESTFEHLLTKNNENSNPHEKLTEINDRNI